MTDGDLMNTQDVKELDVAALWLDKSNPRFGQLAEDQRNQTDILDFIVRSFGVDDVLSSLAVNGYFAAEPLVCRQAEEESVYVVAEGNRRLAACLILLGDERAKHQGSLTRKYQAIHRAHGSPRVNPVPSIVVNQDVNNRALLSYLGVRHIAAAKAWDSYAKAVWIHRVVHEGKIPLEDAAAMIGDEHRTLARLLEGYNVIQQLVKDGRFRPKDSNRRGRGSNTDYPFSWVYTILGYNSVRRFLALEDDPAKTDPIPTDKLDDATLLTRAMFGNRVEGASAAVSDSRELRQLALAVDDPEKVELLKKGKSLGEIERLTEPLEDRLRSGLVDAKEILADLSARLVEEEPARVIADRFAPQSARVKKLAANVDRILQDAANDDAD